LRNREADVAFGVLVGRDLLQDATFAYSVNSKGLYSASEPVTIGKPNLLRWVKGLLGSPRTTKARELLRSVSETHAATTDLLRLATRSPPRLNFVYSRIHH